MKNLVLAVFAALATAAAAPLAVAQTACPAAPAPVVVAPQDITTNTTWTRNNIYLLNGFVYVNAGATLTIEAGTIIKGDLANKGSLIIRQGARLVAVGTAAQPIVFTSNQPAGQRAPGDWGGVIICGRAPVNLPGNPTIEGGVQATFGGPDPLDNSGTLQYVRIEYPGVAFLPNNEINGLTLGGVGAGTTLDHIQVTGSGDDSFEWFGGTVNAKYLVALAGTDDDFDTDNGFAGRVQYGLALRDPRRGDIATGGVSNGFESDNDATGTTNGPKTSAVFSNTTIILPTSVTAAAPFANADGVLIRRNSAQSVFNSVFAGRPYGLNLNSNSVNLTTDNAQSGLLAFQNNVLAGYALRRTGRVTTNSGTTAGFSIRSFVGSTNDTTRTVADLNLPAGTFAFEGDCGASAACTPALGLPAGSLLASGAAFTNPRLLGPGTGVSNNTFDVVNFRGAFGPAGTPAGDWANGWTNFNPQLSCYNRPGQTLANRDVATQNLDALAVAPNPATGPALLQFDLRAATTATVTVLDALGRPVAVLLTNGKLAAGPHALALPATLPNGVYLARVTTAEASQAVRFVVSR